MLSINNAQMPVPPEGDSEYITLDLLFKFLFHKTHHISHQSFFVSYRGRARGNFKLN